MEGVMISGAALDTDEAKVTIDDVPDRPGVAASIFKAIAAEAISVDMIVQNVSRDGTHRHVVHGAARRSARGSRACWTRSRAISARTGSRVDAGIAKLSLVGAGMKSHPGVAADMFDVARRAGINIEMISTSPIRISVRDPQGPRRAGAPRGPRAVRAGGEESAREGGRDRRHRRGGAEMIGSSRTGRSPSTGSFRSPPPGATGSR